MPASSSNAIEKIRGGMPRGLVRRDFSTGNRRRAIWFDRGLPDAPCSAQVRAMIQMLLTTIGLLFSMLPPVAAAECPGNPMRSAPNAY
jgi:hypothetical protein